MSIDVCDRISLKDFQRDYLAQNRPLLLSSESTSHWTCRRDWIKNDLPDLITLGSLFDACRVSVIECKKDSSYGVSDKPRECSFKEFREYMQHHTKDGLRYLKDFHLMRAFPNLNAYETLDLFSDDYINEYWDALGCDDYRFMYFGPDASFTPMHHDVFMSYSWSANICGTKKWILVPPEQTKWLKDSGGNHLDDLEEYDSSRFPNAIRIAPFKVIQKPGETIFVPRSVLLN